MASLLIYSSWFPMKNRMHPGLLPSTPLYTQLREKRSLCFPLGITCKRWEEVWKKQLWTEDCSKRETWEYLWVRPELQGSRHQEIWANEKTRALSVQVLLLQLNGVYLGRGGSDSLPWGVPLS